MSPSKWRAWSYKHKKMFEVTAIFDNGAHVEVREAVDEDGNIKLWEDFVLLQFTGLIDKNDVEIWEKDICAYRNHDYDDWDEPMQHKGIVSFRNGTFLFTNKEGNLIRFSRDGMKTEHHSLEYFGYNQDQIEVLGNVYEQPVLVK